MKKVCLLFVVICAFCFFAACGEETVPEMTVETEATTEATELETSTAAESMQETTEAAEESAEDLDAQDSGIDLTVVRDTIIQTVGVSDPLMLDTSVLFELYGIHAEQVAQSASYVTMSGTFPDEIILIEAVDAASANLITEALQNRMDEVLVQSKTYDADNYAAAQACKVWRNDLFVALILSPRHEEIAACYNELIA